MNDKDDGNYRDILYLQLRGVSRTAALSFDYSDQAWADLKHHVEIYVGSSISIIYYPLDDYDGWRFRYPLLIGHRNSRCYLKASAREGDEV